MKWDDFDMIRGEIDSLVRVIIWSAIVAVAYVGAVLYLAADSGL